MPEPDHRVTVIVALIGVIGTLGAAVIGNWDKIFPPPSPVSSRIESPQTGRAEPPAPQSSPRADSTQTVRNEAPSLQTAPGIEAPQNARTESRSLVDAIPNIAGVWRDIDNPANGTQITQQGATFRLTRWGVLTNGIQFQSSGGGTITGQHLTISYNSQYQTGVTSTGNCSGTVSADGRRMDAGCNDSLLGTFTGTSIR